MKPQLQIQEGVVFRNATIRQTVRLSIGTEELLRLRLSNAFGSEPLTIVQTTLALATKNESGTTEIQSQTIQNASFGGSGSITIPAGAPMVSDAINFGFPVHSNTVLTISIFLEAGHDARCVTTHPGSRTTSYFTKGNRVSEGDFNRLVVSQTDHWWVKIVLYHKGIPLRQYYNFCVLLYKASDSDIGTTLVVSKYLHHKIRKSLLSLGTALRTADVVLLTAIPGTLIPLIQN